MKIVEKELEGTYEIISEPIMDNRGFINRLYDEKIFEKACLNTNWVQLSQSHTEKRNTIRGIHFTLPPFTEAKLIRAVRGKVLWIVIDLRIESETFGQQESTVLTAKDTKSLYSARGFGHGMASLSDDCDLIICADNFFSQAHSTGIIWNDADLDIDWGLDGNPPIISEAHNQFGTFRAFKETYCNPVH